MLLLLLHFTIVLCQKYALNIVLTCPSLPGHPPKLSSTASRHIVCLIGSGKAETTVDVSRILQDTLNTSISAKTVQRNLKSTGLKSVLKSQCPLLSAQHKKVQLDFALAYETGL